MSDYRTPPQPFSKEEYHGFAIEAAYIKGLNAAPDNKRITANPYCEETEEDFFKAWEKGWYENSGLESEEDLKKSLMDAYDWGRHSAKQKYFKKGFNPYLPGIHEQDDQLAAEFKRGYDESNKEALNK